MEDSVGRENGPESEELFESQQMPLGFSAELSEEIGLTDGEWQEPEEFEGSIGRTMFDTPTSKDHTVTVLLPRDKIEQVPSQSLVRIMSRDGRVYLGAVVEGPFAEPDGLRADSPIIVTTTVRGTMFMPKYHGRAQIRILNEEIDGHPEPPRFRPLPNSPVFDLSRNETAEKLNLDGEVRLGLAVGYDNLPVCLPTSRKDVFPRHTGVLGTTGGGKSTTVSGIIGKLGKSDVAVVVFDTEGEYTHIMHPTEDATMLATLERRELSPEGVQKVNVLHLTGRETTNADHPNTEDFCLKFSNISPYAMMEILSLNEAQQGRFLKAYDIARRILMDLKIYPSNDKEKDELLELDEMETGYPRLTLEMMYDIVRACAHVVADEPDYPYFRTKKFFTARDSIMRTIRASNLPGHVWSWRKVQGSLSRLLRLGIFDNEETESPDYESMTKPGNVTIVDLNDTDSPQVNNLVIAELLRGLRAQQEKNYQDATENDGEIRKVVIVVEEAHEFLSAARIRQMPVLFEQVARIARRGRKRWLGLIFVTQLPQHLPDEVLGLINNYILHKIADANVISRLKRSIGGVDNNLWDRLPNLAAGQAIVQAESIARPLLVTIDPTPSKLRMVD